MNKNIDIDNQIERKVKLWFICVMLENVISVHLFLCQRHHKFNFYLNEEKW